MSIATLYAPPAMGEGVKTTIRLPDEIHEAIKRIADEQDRSFNAQLVRALKEWLAKKGNR